MTNNIIETFDLTKDYQLKQKGKKIRALNKVNLEIKEGERFGLLGPNGAGKTTFVSILTTLISPSEGYALVDGHNILKNPTMVRRTVGLMLGNDILYNRLTGFANLKFY